MRTERREIDDKGGSLYTRSCSSFGIVVVVIKVISNPFSGVAHSIKQLPILILTRPAHPLRVTPCQVASCGDDTKRGWGSLLEEFNGVASALPNSVLHKSLCYKCTMFDLNFLSLSPNPQGGGCGGRRMKIPVDTLGEFQHKHV